MCEIAAHEYQTSTILFDNILLAPDLKHIVRERLEPLKATC